MADPKPSLESLTLKAHAAGLNFHYGDFHALKNIEMPIHDKRVTALIGPSGCGKSTFLRCLNRMHDLYPGNRYEGEIRLHPDDVNLLDRAVDPIEVRMRLSMVFQKPNPFPKTIFENVAYGLRVRGLSRSPSSRRRSREGVAAPRSGTRSRTACTSSLQTSRRPAAACASPARWRPSRRSCSSTSRPRRSTRSPRPASRS